jgi:hypothetical protein
MSLKLVKFAKDWDWEAIDKVRMIIEVGEFELAEPSFRKRVRLIAVSDYNKVCFALQYQHDGEPGTWLPDPSFPWHGRNFDSIIRAAVRYHERIEHILEGETANA